MCFVLLLLFGGAALTFLLITGRSKPDQDNDNTKRTIIIIFWGARTCLSFICHAMDVGQKEDQHQPLKHWSIQPNIHPASQPLVSPNTHHQQQQQQQQHINLTREEQLQYV